MACGFETCAAPGAKKIVGAMPAVEAHAEAIVFERAVDFAEGWSNPRSGCVAGNGAPAAVAVADHIRRIGQHEVGAPCGKLRQDSEAVAADDGVCKHESDGLMNEEGSQSRRKPWEPLFLFLCLFLRAE